MALETQDCHWSHPMVGSRLARQKQTYHVSNERHWQQKGGCKRPRTLLRTRDASKYTVQNACSSKKETNMVIPKREKEPMKTRLQRCIGPGSNLQISIAGQRLKAISVTRTLSKLRARKSQLSCCANLCSAILGYINIGSVRPLRSNQMIFPSASQPGPFEPNVQC